MADAAERMKTMRGRRPMKGVREVRLLLPDARTSAVRQRVAWTVARLEPDDEADALAWIESVAECDEPEPPLQR